MGLKLLLAGRGGQGVLFVMRILSSAALAEGIPIIGSETHGMAQRGGSVVAHLKIGAGFRSPLIMRGRADILLSLDFLEGLRNFDYLGRGATALINGAEDLPPPITSAAERLEMDVSVLDATKIALSLGSYLSLNAVMLGALASKNLLPFSVETLRSIVGKTGSERVRKLNVMAFDVGRKQMDECREK